MEDESVIAVANVEKIAMAMLASAGGGGTPSVSLTELLTALTHDQGRWLGVTMIPNEATLFYPTLSYPPFTSTPILTSLQPYRLLDSLPLTHPPL